MSLKDIQNKLEKLSKAKVKAGWFSGSNYPDGTPVAYVATIQEYGYQGGGINIPPRPFLRPAEADHKKEWGDLASRAAIKFSIDKLGFDAVGDVVGQKMEDDVADAIINGAHAPLSPITLLLRKWRDEGRKITKSTVEEARRYLAKNPNATLSGRTKPLNDTELMLTSLSHKITKK